MPLHQIKLQCVSEREAESLVGQIEVLLPDEFSSLSYVRGPHDDWTISLIPNEQSAPKEAVLSTVQSILTENAGARFLGLEELPDQDWVAHSLQDLAPVTSGRFVVHGSHDRPFTGFGRIGISVDAGLAFGTGHHETTKACLKLLSEVLKKRRPRKTLDLGCGTGVLAIASTKRSPRTAIATDIDPIAIKVAKENTAANQVSGQILYAVADGPRHPLVTSEAPFDLIFANILANPLKRMANSISSVMDSSGRLILSGLLSEQEPSVLSAYRMVGFRLESRYVLGAWSTLLLTKARPSN